VGIDSMLLVPSTVGSINNAENSFYIANNGGMARSNDNPTTGGSFSLVFDQAYLGGITLVLEGLGKVSPGRRGVPQLLVYRNALYMARNRATNQDPGTVNNGGELWRCTTNCGTAANWSRVLSSTTGVGSGTGIERTSNQAISLLEVSGEYLYIGFDNMEDGFRLYRTSVAPTGAASFTEVGRVADAGCTNHTGDTGAIGGLCYAYQGMSSTTISKAGDDYLYLTVGCTLASESVNGGRCDTDPGAGFRSPPIRVLVQKD
jgi:hypothetical protein